MNLLRAALYVSCFLAPLTVEAQAGGTPPTASLNCNASNFNRAGVHTANDTVATSVPLSYNHWGHIGVNTHVPFSALGGRMILVINGRENNGIFKLSSVGAYFIYDGEPRVAFSGEVSARYEAGPQELTVTAAGSRGYVSCVVAIS